jgi:hypothetical protein
LTCTPCTQIKFDSRYVVFFHLQSLTDHTFRRNSWNTITIGSLLVPGRLFPALYVQDSKIYRGNSHVAFRVKIALGKGQLAYDLRCSVEDGKTPDFVGIKSNFAFKSNGMIALHAVFLNRTICFVFQANLKQVRPSGLTIFSPPKLSSQGVPYYSRFDPW